MVNKDAFIGKEINQVYLKEDTRQKVRKSFLHGEFPAVILKDFFSTEFYSQLTKKVSALDFKKEQVVVHHSYAVSKSQLSSKELTDFISFVTKKKIDELHFTAYLLTWKDYQILNDRYLEKPGIDIVIDLTDGWNPECGGVVTFTDGRGTVYPLAPAGNSLAMVERKKGLQKYVQYLNHHAKDKKRLFLIASI
ncbi:MAG: hypothetical protein Q7S55_00640 [Nanoarchaeota archaeon]|nr:hypothetical protein [Nanoarchaeota archaeon]